MFSAILSTGKHSYSMSACLVSMLVRVLEAKVIGLASWMRIAPRPYSLASVCITMGLVQSKYVRVVLNNGLPIHCLSQQKAAYVDGF